MYIFLQIFDVENDVTVVCLCMFNVYIFLLQIISFQRPCLGGLHRCFVRPMGYHHAMMKAMIHMAHMATLVMLKQMKC